MLISGEVSVGVASVGLVPNTSAPDPVSSVTADAKLEEEGVARNVSTPEPSPVTFEIDTEPVAYAKEAHAVDPLPIFVLRVSVSRPHSPAASVGLAEVHWEAVPRRT
jgi:hypothetical protein